MVTLSAISDNLTASAINRQINGLSRGATQLIERSRAIPINLDLPSLIRNGDSKRLTASVSSTDANSSIPFDLKFQKIRAGVIRVTASNPNSASERSATFDIHLNNAGKVHGFDTTGNGRINSLTTPNLSFTGNGPLFQFDFNDRRSGPVQFSQFSFPAAILDVLQGSDNPPITGTTSILFQGRPPVTILSPARQWPIRLTASPVTTPLMDSPASTLFMVVMATTPLMAAPATIA
jgi:hypothetical protein